MAVTEIKNPTPIEKEIEKKSKIGFSTVSTTGMAVMTAGWSGATLFMSLTLTTMSTERG